MDQSRSLGIYNMSFAKSRDCVVQIRLAIEDDWHWIEGNASAIGGPEVVSCGTLYRLRDHEGFVAITSDRPLGFAVLREDEILGLAVPQPGNGVGSLLMAHCEHLLLTRGYSSAWLVTTNDNLDAMRFYQRRGYILDALHKGAFAEVKRIKGLSGEVLGNFGIPIRDELVFRKSLKT